MARNFVSITNLGGGRSLVSSPTGDQYFVEDETGSRTKVSLQEAAVLLQKAKEVEPDKPAKKPTIRRRSTKETKPLPISKAEIEAAASYLILHDPKDRSRFAALALEFKEAVRIKMQEIEKDIRSSFKGRDPRDRTPEIGINQYRNAAKLFLADLRDKKT